MSSWGSGLLAVAGGIGEGMAGAVREQAQDERKMSIEDRKQEALLARQKNLARYSADLQAEGRTAQNQWSESQEGSGFYQDGHEITKAEYAAMDEASRSKLMTTQGREEYTSAQELKNRKDFSSFELDGRKALTAMELDGRKALTAMELQGRRAALEAKNKRYTPSELKYMQENALNDLSARLQSKGAMVDLENGTIAIHMDKNGNPDEESLIALDQSGFSFSTGQSFKEDKQGLFSGDNHYLTVHLGGFDPSRINSNEYENTETGGGDYFDDLHSRVKGKKKDGAKNTNNSIDDTEPQTSKNNGLLAGAGNHVEQTPMDPRTWNVQFMGQGEEIGRASCRERV